MTVLFQMDVLRAGDVPVREARTLYQALLDADNRVLLATDEDAARTEHWLMLNGIKGYANIISPLVDLGDGKPLWQRQIEVARVAGRLDLVVTSNPEVIAWCLEHDTTALLFAHPKHTAPGFRPDATPRTWAQIQEQIVEKKARDWVVER